MFILRDKLDLEINTNEVLAKISLGKLRKKQLIVIFMINLAKDHYKK